MDNAYFGRMSVRRYLTNNGESVTRLFSTVLASMAYTQRKPKELLTSFYGCPTREEGVAVQALYLTPEIRTCVAGLQRLELHLEATDEHFKNRTTWHSYLANFLNATPQLRDLRLGFCQDWKVIANVFAPVADTVHLPSLLKLDLQHIRCGGFSLRNFLRRHDTIERLELGRLQITGETSYAQVLKCRQIAQDDVRLEFGFEGVVTWDERWAPRDASSADEELLDSFVSITKPDKYCGMVEQWEGVRRRIGEVREDIVVTETPWMSDTTVGSPYGEYYWLQLMSE
ncbi:hypothetical protein LTR17_003714 [Elasticomyces elasticus]|nr:hypothetical protein LTR17_003714 [Elasticomyces elasticus]